MGIINSVLTPIGTMQGLPQSARTVSNPNFVPGTSPEDIGKAGTQGLSVNDAIKGTTFTPYSQEEMARLKAEMDQQQGSYLPGTFADLSA